MRAAMLLDTDAPAAAQTARAILKTEPTHEAAGLLLAAACRRLGDPSNALAALEALAAARPDSALLQLELGGIFGEQGRSVEAMQVLERAIALDATLAQAWRQLSSLRMAADDCVGADTAYMQYRRLATDPAELAEAYAAFDQNRLDAAEALANGRAREGESAVAALTLLSAIALRRGDDSAEENFLGRLLHLAGCDNSAREQLVRLMLRQGRSEEALPLLDRLLAWEPRSVAPRILKAEALRLAERHAEGLAMLMDLLSDQPDNPDFWVLAGNQQRYMGGTAEALASYRKAIELRPGFGAAYLALANFKTLRFSADDIRDMQAQLSSARSSDLDAKSLLFALAKALEDEGAFEAAFDHYVEANRRARAEFDYESGAQSAFVKRFEATFTRSFFAARRAWSGTSVEPIFIVGLPRSGSTLVEQILASHSQVEGTRELPYLPVIARELAGRRATARYPAHVATLQEADVEALAGRYVAAALKHCKQGKPRFIDKMHGNFSSIGLIHLMFPRACIIDARRQPMAWGFACYKQLFSPGMNFAYDLQELGLYYRDYAELMRHVDDVLPGRVHRVHYERLVTDTQSEVRRLLDYCRLPFEPRCLKFHENPRIAQTISSEQVRVPIYGESVDQWRNFEPWLGPLRSALGDEPG
jgi:tetratricopeptide (TPR) repeat protein